MPAPTQTEFEAMLPFHVTILFGESHPKQEPMLYRFATQAELDAFLQGVEAMDGWLSYEILGDEYPTTIAAKSEVLTSHGFTIGAREPKLNTLHPGAFMVAEALDEWDGVPTEDGANGPWCIVGDDLDALIFEAFQFHNGMTFEL